MKTFIVVLIAVAVCAGGIFALYRWPEPTARKGGLTVLAAVEQARRRFKKAQAMLTASAFKVPEGKKVTSTEDVILRKEMELDETALDVLKQAQAELAAVLGKNADAEPQARALAHATIGRILALRAWYHAQMAAKAWQTARDARNKAYGLSAEMGSLGVRARFYDRLAGLTTDAQEAESAAADKLQKDLQGQIGTIDAKVTDLEKTRAALLADNAKLAKEAEQLNTAAQLALKAKEGLDKFEQAQLKEKEITKSRLEIDKIESQINNLKAARDDLAIQLSNAGARVTVADAVIQDRKKLKGEQEAQVTAYKGKLAKVKTEIEGLATEAYKACQDAAKACAKAMPLYEEAEKSLGQSVTLQPQERTAEALAAQGDLLMAWAQLQARQLANQRENELYVQDIEKVWVDPADLEAGAPGSSTPVTLCEDLRSLRGFLKQSGKVRDAAKAKYTKAVELYQSAMRSLREKRLVWAYQGQLARAYLRLYQLSGNADAASLSEAKKLLQDATKGREDSKFIRPLVDERDSLP